MTLTLWRKNENGGYTNTGWTTPQRIPYGGGPSEGDGYSMVVSLSGQQAGSFCLRLTLKRGIPQVAEDVCYFIVEEAVDNSGSDKPGEEEFPTATNEAGEIEG